MKLETEEKRDIAEFPKAVQEKIFQMSMNVEDEEIKKYVNRSHKDGITDIFPVEHDYYTGINPEEFVCGHVLKLEHAIHPAKNLYLFSNDRFEGFEYIYSMKLDHETINLKLVQSIEHKKAKAYLFERIDVSKPGYAFFFSKEQRGAEKETIVTVIECN